MEKMIKLNRAENAKKSILWSCTNKMILLVFPFVLRMVFFRKLSADSLGLDSLFSSILQVLNLSELGFSSAVVYAMYSPIAHGDSDTVCAIVRFLKKVYFMIGILILSAGLLLMPWIKYFIKGSDAYPANIYILFFIYLVNTSASYMLFAYRETLLTAYQRNDVRSIIYTLTKTMTYMFQIVIIITTKNYYYYAACLVAGTVANNILIKISTEKLFPEVHGQGNIDKILRTDILLKAKGLMLDKICSVSRNSLDSICISGFLGLAMNAKYNNYYMILAAVVSLLSMIGHSIIGGVGNSVVTETVEKNFGDMKKINFLYMWISGWFTTCLFCLYQPFISLAYGAGMKLSKWSVCLFCIYFYVLEMGTVRGIYSDACGLWWENRYRTAAEIISNIVLNVVLGKLWGINGIIAATLISLIIINFAWGSHIIFIHYFKGISIKEYFIPHMKYAMVTGFVAAITNYVCGMVPYKGGLGIAVMLAVCALVPNLLYIVLFRQFEIYRAAMEWIGAVLHVDRCWFMKWLVK